MITKKKQTLIPTMQLISYFLSGEISDSRSKSRSSFVSIYINFKNLGILDSQIASMINTKICPNVDISISVLAELQSSIQSTIYDDIQNNVSCSIESFQAD